MTTIIQNDRLSPELFEQICNETNHSNYDSLRHYLNEHDRSCSDEQYHAIQNYLETTIRNQSDFFCHLIYFIMEHTNQWGDSGEESVKSSFCRNLLNIPADRQIDYQDAIAFQSIIESKRSEHGLDRYSITKAKKQFERFTFSISDKKFQLHDCHKLTKILHFCEIPLILQGGNYGPEKELILADGIQEKTGEYDIIYILNEHIRTPNTVVSMAAIIGDKQIYLRREAIETIFYQKWFPIITHQDHYYQPDTQAFILSSKIKQLALSHSLLNKESDIAHHKEPFISKIMETIRYHELGHGIIQYHYFEKEIGAFAEATKMFGETIFTAVLELLAEIAPQHNDLQGPLSYLCSLSQSNHNQATGIFYSYLSDAWFYDTNDTHMFPYSDLICLVMVQSITHTHTIDFNSLGQHFNMTNPHNLVSWCIDTLTTLINEWIPTFKSASYKYKKKTYTFNELTKKIAKEIENEYTTIEYESYNYYTAYWSQVFECYLKIESNKKSVDQKLSKLTTTIQERFYEKVCGTPLPQHSSIQTEIEKILINKKL